MENLNLQNTIIATVLGGLIVSFLGFLISKIYLFFVKRGNKRKEVKRWQENEIAKLVAVDGSNHNIEIVKSKMYITTMGQTDGPHNSDDVIVISQARFNLVDKLLSEMLQSISSIGKKRYMILGGSGMGKTIFSSALCYNYIFKYKDKIPYPLHYVYLGKKDVISHIGSIQDDNKHEASIVLDALDENLDAEKNFNVFYKELLTATSDYKMVIIICRTQFFFDAKQQPQTDIITEVNDTSKEKIKTVNIYISPFDEVDTEKYIRNKYEYGSENYHKALNIINKTDDLMSRPLLLSYIDDLITLEKNSYYVSAELYMQIINSWLKREYNFRYRDNNELKECDLFDLSKTIAMGIFYKYLSNGNSNLSEEEFTTLITKKHYEIDPRKFQKGSLVNRNDNGFIKFAHKSFWEFFLAIISIERPGLSFNPITFGMGTVFAREIHKLYLQNKHKAFAQISFFKPNILINHDLSDSYVINKLNQIKSEYKKQNYNVLNALIFDLWSAILQRFTFQNKMIISFCSLITGIARSSSDEKFRSELTEITKKYIFSLTEVIKLLHTLQDYILNKEKSWIQDIIDITDQIIRDTQNLAKYSSNFIYKGEDNLQHVPYIESEINEIEETLVFPYILDELNYSTNLRIEKLTKEFVSIGRGFNDNANVIKLVKFIVNDKLTNPDPLLQTNLYIKKMHKCIGIYSEGDNIDEHVSLILDLREAIQKKTYEIILQLTIKGKEYFYYINSKSNTFSKSQIYSFLNNMINIDD